MVSEDTTHRGSTRPTDVKNICLFLVIIRLHVLQKFREYRNEESKKFKSLELYREIKVPGVI